MYTPPPVGYGYYYAPQSPDPKEIERKDLRSTAGFIGVFLLVLIGTMQLTFTVISLLLVAIGWLPADALTQDMLGLDNTTYLLLYSLVYAVAMGLPLLLILFRKKKFFPLSPAKPVDGSVAFMGVLGGIGVCMFANIVTSYLLAILSEFGLPIPEMPQMMENTVTSYLLNLFAIAVLPALLEETVFRGCVLRLLRPYGDGFAVLVSAIVFSLMHGNIRQIPFALIVGLVLGWLYVATNNIWVSVAVHFLNNAVSVTMEYLAFRLPEGAVDIFYTGIILALTAVGLIFGILLLVLRHNQLKLAPKSTLLSGGERFGTLFKAPTFLIAMILFVLLTILGM